MKLVLARAGARLSLEVEAEKFPETRADEFAQILLGLELADRSEALSRRHGVRRRAAFAPAISCFRSAASGSMTEARSGGRFRRSWARTAS